jgi:hypothetical protein
MSNEKKQSQGDSGDAAGNAERHTSGETRADLKDKLKEMGVMPSEESSPNVDEPKHRRRGGAMILGVIVVVIAVLVWWFSGNDEVNEETANAPPASGAGTKSHTGAGVSPSTLASGTQTAGQRKPGVAGSPIQSPPTGPGYGYRPQPWEAPPPWGYQSPTVQQKGTGDEPSQTMATPPAAYPPGPPPAYYPAPGYWPPPAYTYYGYRPYYGPPPGYYGYGPRYYGY